MAALEQQLSELLQQKRELEGRLAHKEEEYQETILTLRNSLEDLRTKVTVCDSVRLSRLHMFTRLTHTPCRARADSLAPRRTVALMPSVVESVKKDERIAERAERVRACSQLC